MSFSTELKEEISKTENLSNKEAVRYELLGYLISSNISQENNKTKLKLQERDIVQFQYFYLHLKFIYGTILFVTFFKNPIK